MRPYHAILLTCEHATNYVPRSYTSLFAGHETVLDTHRGYDIGIASVARSLARQSHWVLREFPLSRLLVEPNRSQRHRIFSEFSQVLSPLEQQRLIDGYYAPYRLQVCEDLERMIKRDRCVLHLSLHSFTPVWQGRTRNADIGVLYDPARQRECHVTLHLRTALQQDLGVRVRRNYPYRGTSDGLCTSLRRQFKPTQYLGIELEVNQARLQGVCAAWNRRLCTSLLNALR
jgi:predicted N-formylglutamate amidohydrolase